MEQHSAPPITANSLTLFIKKIDWASKRLDQANQKSTKYRTDQKKYVNQKLTFFVHRSFCFIGCRVVLFAHLASLSLSLFAVIECLSSSWTSSFLFILLKERRKLFRTYLLVLKYVQYTAYATFIHVRVLLLVLSYQGFA